MNEWTNEWPKSSMPLNFLQSWVHNQMLKHKQDSQCVQTISSGDNDWSITVNFQKEKEILFTDF